MRSARLWAGFIAATLTLVPLSACSSGGASTGTSPTASSSSAGAITVTDVEGRTVTFDKQPERIVLGEGRGLFVTSVLDRENPLDHVVAMGSDLKSNVPDFYHKLEQKVPAVKDVQDIGSIQKGDVLAETLTALQPDVLVMSLDQYKAAESASLLQQLDTAKIPYVVTDFRAKPLENTTKSVQVYGTLLGKEAQAEAFNKTWQETVDRVKDTAAKATQHPSVFVWRAAGLSDCCGSWNNSNISELVNFAGGKNAADGVIDGESGDLTPEKVVELNPDVIITTGGDWSAKKNKKGEPAQFAAAGYDIDPATAQETLNNLITNQPGFDLLKAPKDGQLHNIWHQFYNSPLNYVALLQIAKWLHPEDYKDVDIEAVWQDAHEKFMPFSGEGTFFATNK